ncbi:MAG: hypothetical protein ACOC54_01435 [Candidatus Sumerlaeota bacterium]
MKCPKCGRDNPEKTFTCKDCGALLVESNSGMTMPRDEERVVAQKSGSNGLAVASLILGILGFLCGGIIFALPGLIIGIIALFKPQGKGLAIAGVAVSGIVVALNIAFLAFFFIEGGFPDIISGYTDASERATISLVRSDLRSIATGLEAYKLDYNIYPPHQKALTTPVAYLTSVLEDPYSFSGSGPYKYYRAGDESWILTSPGPDMVEDIDPVEDFEADVPQPSEIILQKSYDPTNGTDSGGDIWRVKY